MTAGGVARRDAQAPLRDQVREELRARIADGRLRPGDRIFEHDLAVELGISRVPVREAIRMLQSEGFVEVQPRRRGVLVRRLDRRQVEELFDVREALEALAARLAAGRASPEVAARLATLVEEARSAFAAGDVEAMGRANAAFHDEIIALAGNELLAAILEPLHGRLAWLYRQNVEPERVCQEHGELQAAIAAGDAEAAAAVALRHVRASRRMVFERMLG